MRSKIERHVSPEPNSGCWLWSGCVNKDGYGLVHDASQNTRNVLAHRASWKSHNGPIPFGLCVLHRCDVRSCVNPAHLFLGTRTENAADRNAKGRTQRGEMQGGAKLTRQQIDAIRADPRRQRTIAADYGITQAHVSSIKTGRRWGWAA